MSLVSVGARPARLLYYQLLARFDLRVKYRAFSRKRTEDFDAFLRKRVDNPAKAKVLEWLAHEPTLGPEFSLLDIGCGPGVFARMILSHPTLASRVRYEGLDQSANALDYLKQHAPQAHTHHRDVLARGLPDRRYDVIAINQVVEHMPSYKEVVATALRHKPKVFVLTTFAALPDTDHDRRLWEPDRACYMNTYSAGKLHQFLRQQTNAEIWVYDNGVQRFDRFWFPRKALMAWYVRLSAGQQRGTDDE